MKLTKIQQPDIFIPLVEGFAGELWARVLPGRLMVLRFANVKPVEDLTSGGLVASLPPELRTWNRWVRDITNVINIPRTVRIWGTGPDVRVNLAIHGQTAAWPATMEISGHFIVALA